MQGSGERSAKLEGEESLRMEEKTVSDKLRIGLVGCGGIAGAHLSAYQNSGLAQVVAVSDIDEAKASALAAKAEATAYTSYMEMIEKERLDAVSLLTPPHNHRQIAEEVLAAGVPIFSEKPLAKTVADSQAMVDAARRTGKLLLVAQCHRFHEPVRRAKALIENGDLGKIVNYRNRFGYVAGTPDARTRGRGGILLDNGSHSSYLFRYLVGEVKSVFGWAPANQRGAIEDLCVCTLLLESVDGPAGIIELDGASKPCPNAIEVFGEKGAVVIDYSSGKSFFKPATGDPVELNDPSLPGAHRFDREVLHFLRCVRGEEEPEIGAEEGLADVRVLQAAYASMNSGKAELVTG